MNCIVIALERSGMSLDVPDDQIDEYLTNYLKKYDLNSIKTIVITSLLEMYHSDHLEYIQKAILSIKKITGKKIIVVLNRWYLNQYSVHGVDGLLYIDALMYWVYQETIIHKSSPPATQYKKSNRWLFLIGKPDKTQRIGILYQLYKRNLYSHGDWSLYVHNDYIKEECKKYLPPMSEEEFETFISNSLRTLDDPPIHFFPDGSHFPGIPFDWKVYDRAGFQVIGESDMNYAAHQFTEKTYLAIINKRPFIVLTSMGALKDFKLRGFKNFTEYLLLPKYNDEYQPNDVTPVVDNIEYWINNIEKQYNKIVLDVEHNYKKFIDLARIEGSKISELIKKHNLDCTISNIIQGY